MTDMSGDLGILHAWANHTGNMLVPLPVQGDMDEADTLVRLGAAIREFGQYTESVGKSLADKRLTDNELKRIDRECGELISALNSVRFSLKAKNQELHR
jgi:hypothetical protein